MTSYLLTVLICSAFVGQGISYGKIYIFHFALGVSFLFLLKWLDKIKLSSLEILIIPYIMVIYSFASLAWSPNVTGGLKETLQLGCGVLFLTLVRLFNCQPLNPKLYSGIKLVLWINVIISLAEGVGLFRYPISQLSEFAPYFGKDLNDWIPGMFPGVPTGFHWNANYNGFFILLTLPIMLGRQKVAIVYFLLSSIIIIMTVSKLLIAAWLLFVFILACALVRKSGWKGVIIATTISIVAVTFILDFISANPYRKEKYAKTFSSLSRFSLIVPEIVVNSFQGQQTDFNFKDTDYSLHERLILFEGITRISMEHFWFGIGAGGLSNFKNEKKGIALGLQSPHFYFLEIIGKYGILIFIIYLYFILRMILMTESFAIRISLAIFVLINPVISSSFYFLPKWGIYALSLIPERDEIT